MAARSPARRAAGQRRVVSVGFVLRRRRRRRQGGVQLHAHVRGHVDPPDRPDGGMGRELGSPALGVCRRPLVPVGLVVRGGRRRRPGDLDPSDSRRSRLAIRPPPRRRPDGATGVLPVGDVVRSRSTIMGTRSPRSTRRSAGGRAASVEADAPRPEHGVLQPRVLPVGASVLRRRQPREHPQRDGSHWRPWGMDPHACRGRLRRRLRRSG